MLITSFIKSSVSTFVDSFGCNCSSVQTRPNVPANQRPTARLVKKTIEQSNASSSSSSSTNSLSTKSVTKTVFSELTASQKDKILGLISPESDRSNLDQVHISIVFSLKTSKCEVSLQESPDSPYVTETHSGQTRDALAIIAGFKPNQNT